MKINTIKTNIIFKISIPIFVFFVFIASVNAQTQPRDYNVIAPLPGTNDNCAIVNGVSNCPTRLSTYLPGAFNLAVGIAVALAFIFITIGGVTYATSDSLTGKQDGRNYIENAVLGLLLVIGSYVILYTINPQILTFNILVRTPVVTPTTPSVVPIVPSGACVSGCLPFAGTGLPVTGSAVGTGISSIMMPKLIALNSLLNANNIPWRITEGFPPSRTHVAACHQNGTCIDATPVSKTPQQLNAFFTYAQQNGLRAVFEVQTEEERHNLTSTVNRDNSPRRNPDGTPFVPYTGTIIVVPRISGSHFSVYNQ